MLAASVTPTEKYQAQCVQYLADRLTALEERMTESEFRTKHLEKIQVQSAAAITDIQLGLAAQQNALEGIQRSLAPLGNLKADMLEVMNQMMQTMKVEILCDKWPGPPQPAERKAITDSGHNAPSPIQNERVGEQGKRSLQKVIKVDLKRRRSAL